MHHTKNLLQHAIKQRYLLLPLQVTVDLCSAHLCAILTAHINLS